NPPPSPPPPDHRIWPSPPHFLVVFNFFFTVLSGLPRLCCCSSCRYFSSHSSNVSASSRSPTTIRFSQSSIGTPQNVKYPCPRSSRTPSIPCCCKNLFTCGNFIGRIEPSSTFCFFSAICTVRLAQLNFANLSITSKIACVPSLPCPCACADENN